MSQRIVINNCYGGFRLSTEAMLRLIEMGSDAIETKDIFRYCGSKTLEAYKKDKFNKFKEFKDVGNGFINDVFIEDVVYKDNLVYSLKDKYGDTFNIRAHKDLIKVVEEMGEKANGKCAELKIVEIPDGVKWTIDEYDGMETVEEEHRSWG